MTACPGLLEAVGLPGKGRMVGRHDSGRAGMRAISMPTVSRSHHLVDAALSLPVRPYAGAVAGNAAPCPFCCGGALGAVSNSLLQPVWMPVAWQANATVAADATVAGDVIGHAWGFRRYDPLSRRAVLRRRMVHMPRPENASTMSASPLAATAVFHMNATGTGAASLAS